MKRYFIVTYVCSMYGSFSNGWISIILPSGYLNPNAVELSVIEGGKSEGIEITNVVPTNIIELTESDFNDWNA
jgi:hypothetical protein